MKKLAMIRQQRECPFGLTVPRACSCVGPDIFKMKQLSQSDNPSEDKKNNLEKLKNIKDISQCPFAGRVLRDGAVVCNYNPSSSFITDNVVLNMPESTNPAGLRGVDYTPTNDVNNNPDPSEQMYRSLYYGIYQQASKKDKMAIRAAIFKRIKG